jgi:hypothetical protein
MFYKTTLRWPYGKHGAGRLGDNIFGNGATEGA